jgi:hypothetical protein
VTDRFFPLPPHTPRRPRTGLDSPPVQTGLGFAAIAIIVLLSAIAVLHRFGIYAL